jgi:arylsulfatase A-like enzyme
MNRSTLALLPILAGAAACTADREPTDRPNVLLITLDTTRADHLGCYGYERDTSPNLDRVADDALVFENMISTASWTLPAHASLFTGKFTSSHGARYDPEGNLKLTSGISGPKDWDDYRARSLAVGERTLAELLAESGYATAGVVAGPWMMKPFGLDRGFDHYDDDQISNVTGRLAEDVTASALAWLSLPRTKPFFLFLNYYDPHSPFGAPAPHTFEFVPEGKHHANATKNKRNWIHFYDGEIRYMDLHLGHLFDALRADGTWDDTLVIVTADHGELFGEKGRWGHGEYLSEEELHIPLIVKYPRGEERPGRRTDPIQTIDVLPMILRRIGAELPLGIQGGAPHPLVAEVYPLPDFAPNGDWKVLYDWPRKFVWNSQGLGGLYDIEADPGERKDLAGGDDIAVDELNRTLQTYLKSLPPPGEQTPAQPLDAGTLERLRNLGYIGDDEEEEEEEADDE